MGIDVGGTKCMAVVVDRAGEVLVERQRTTPVDGDVNELLNVLGVLARETAQAGDVEIRDAVVGLGLPGMVDLSGRLVFSPHLPAAVGGDVGGLLRDAIGAKGVVVDNDANFAALAEQRWGVARDWDAFVMVTLGTGIGGGLFLGGRVHRGASGFAGEIGHVNVVHDGELCACGGRGCWEKYASGGALARRVERALERGELSQLSTQWTSSPSPHEVTRAADRGDLQAKALVEETGTWLGRGIANIVATLDVHRFVIGGGLSVSPDVLIASARAAVDFALEGSQFRPPVEIASAHYGPRAGAVGASGAEWGSS